ncbi:amidohydrolase family protein [Chitinophaga niabensis]|uniref:Cytosine/adenosine deaminase n=1 Tax=Chitinophaga niabensis TaxID=536979 RepID=A0A1N6JFE8_9BACT|nr:amidohydrolase family protein [Chitinophaga niabensis]SIO43072.1 Cytosine/adenosine deaminase [Chitinophaga niabensis]
MIKLAADDIFDGQRFHGPDRVLILDDTGKVSALVPRSWAGEDIQQVEGWLSPGFINTHCHLELSHMKGKVPEHTGLPVFLRTVMEQRQPPTAETLEAAIAAAGKEMEEEGIVAVGDICNTPATLEHKLRSPLYWHSFVECMGFIDAVAHQRLEHSATVFSQFAAKEQPVSLVPHAPYSVSATLFKLLGSMEGNAPVSIHNQECPAEDELYKHKTGDFLGFYQHFGIDIAKFSATGTSSLQSYLPYFSHTPKMLLVHNTYTTEMDIRFANSRPQEIFWCLCPNANMYIENRLPDIPAFLQLGARMTLGTDSLASNHQLSIWAEIKTIREQYPHIPLTNIMQWATINGAQALDIADLYGSFDKGKKPGLVQIVNDEARVFRMA